MMGSTFSKLAGVAALGLAFLLGSSSSPADAVGRGAAAPRPAQGQEVVTGSYSCSGTVYSDDQEANVWAGALLSATSGITSGFFGSSQRSTQVPADLAAMAALCLAHVGEVLAQVPSVCALGPISSEQAEFGNGASTWSGFDFSCQGTRDEVIGVIGGMSRLSLTTRLR